MNYEMIAGILVAVIVTASGTTLYLQQYEDGSYKNCAGGWEFNQDNGMYDCASSLKGSFISKKTK